jgi:hypothetical protein
MPIATPTALEPRLDLAALPPLGEPGPLPPLRPRAHPPPELGPHLDGDHVPLAGHPARAHAGARAAEPAREVGAEGGGHGGVGGAVHDEDAARADLRGEQGQLARGLCVRGAGEGLLEEAGSAGPGKRRRREGVGTCLG